MLLDAHCTYQSNILKNSFNDDISQSRCQEITSVDYFQYSNSFFQDFQNVITEDYSQYIQTFNQEIATQNYNQYMDCLYEHDYNQ